MADARGSMIVDIGGGTTEVAVISLGGIVVARSIRVAGDEMDEDIMNYARQKYNLLIGEQMAESVKIECGSAYPMETERTVCLRGRNLISGLPESIEISSVELREALRNSVGIIVDTVRQAIDETPPELISDLMEHGIALAGGGALVARPGRTPERRDQDACLRGAGPADLCRTRRRKGAGELRHVAQDAGEHAARQHVALMPATRNLIRATGCLTRRSASE